MARLASQADRMGAGGAVVFTHWPGGRVVSSELRLINVAIITANHEEVQHSLTSATNFIGFWTDRSVETDALIPHKSATARHAKSRRLTSSPPATIPFIHCVPQRNTNRQSHDETTDADIAHHRLLLHPGSDLQCHDPGSTRPNCDGGHHTTPFHARDRLEETSARRNMRCPM